MELLNNDVFSVIVGFCTAKDVCMLTQTNKYNIILSELGDKLWEEMGKRDHPYLSIKSKHEYRVKRLDYVDEYKLLFNITSNKWAVEYMSKILIPRGPKSIDHIIPAYIRSIMRLMYRVDKLKQFKENNNNLSTDWKVSVNILIDDLLTQSENEHDEMDKIIKFYE